MPMGSFGLERRRAYLDTMVTSIYVLAIQRLINIHCVETTFQRSGRLMMASFGWGLLVMGYASTIQAANNLLGSQIL